MRCPLCGNRMREQDLGPIQVDACSCGSRWFDWGELAKIDSSDGTKPLTAGRISGRARFGPRDSQIPCPRCQTPMREHRYKNVPRVLIDECYSCRGFFLDPGELEAIRQDLAARDEKDRKLETLLDTVPGYRRDRLEASLARDRAEALDKFCKRIMTKFLGIPGF